MSQSANPMVSPRVTKVTVNIGVGEGGQRLQLAEQALEMVTGMTPVRTLATSTNSDLGTRQGSPIGCKVTSQHIIPTYNFDLSGNLSFGITDYTDFPWQKYDPDIGIYGMDVNVVLERPGHRVSRRRRHARKVSVSHRVGPDESRAWFAEHYKLKIVGYGEEE